MNNNTISIITSYDERFMNEAIKLAQRAASAGEVPVGAVITLGGRIVSSAFNRRESDKNALAHAEMLAIDAACRKLGGWRLHRCTLYVTLEPCPMCAGAIVNSRIKRVVFGAYDAKAGAFGSVINLNSYPLNHRPDIAGGVLGEECAALLGDFFKKKRNKMEAKRTSVK